ncbi:MAG: hypothetical protein AAF443_03745 [Chlamydiota bacterium]
MDKKLGQADKKFNMASKSPDSEASFFSNFETFFCKEKQVEEKIACAVAFMRAVLSQSDKMNLKDFWEAKKMCAPLFKESMSPIKRNHLWSEYSELIAEAVRLREFFDEQIAFAVEQIELAVTALESDIEHYEQLVEKVRLPVFSAALQKIKIDKQLYQKWQSELKILKVLIARLDALRAEVLGQDMRISQKNRFLKRLTKLGDALFPRRKAVIKAASDQFTRDVEAFFRDSLPQESGAKESALEKRRLKPLYALREIVKDFQALGKALSLNASAFSKSRKWLSQCWDWIKEKNKERKQELGKQSQEHQENFTKLKEKVNSFRELCSSHYKIAREKVIAEEAHLAADIKKTELSREGREALRFEINAIKKEALGKIEQAAIAFAKEQREKVQHLRETILEAIEQEQQFSVEVLQKKESEFLNLFNALDLTSMERHLFERQIADLRSFIFDKQAATDSPEVLEQLLEERKRMQEDIRKQIETYRLKMGGSRLDFEQAMTYRELYDSAKIHLDRELEALDELREKLGS